MENEIEYEELLKQLSNSGKKFVDQFKLIVIPHIKMIQQQLNLKIKSVTKKCNTNFSIIYQLKSELKGKNENYILKIIKDNENNKHMLMLRQEIDILKKIEELDCNIDQFPKILYDLGQGYLMNDLGESLKQNDSIFSSNDRKKQFFAQMICLLGWLTSQGYLQADIKPLNFLQKNNKFYLIDFSHAINFYELGKSGKIHIPGGTYLYSSPNTKAKLIESKNKNINLNDLDEEQENFNCKEVVEIQEYLNQNDESFEITGTLTDEDDELIVQSTNAPKHDVFSFGVTFLYLIGEASDKELQDPEYNNTHTFFIQHKQSIIQNLGNLFYQILYKMLEKDINQRYDFQEIRNMLWYSINSPYIKFHLNPKQNFYLNIKLTKQIQQQSQKNQQQQQQVSIQNQHEQQQIFLQQQCDFEKNNGSLMRIFNQPNYYLKHYLPTQEVLSFLNLNRRKLQNPEQLLQKEFQNNFMNKQKDKKTYNHIINILNKKDKQLIEKLIKIYTSPTNFYKKINSDLAQQNLLNFENFFTTFMWERNYLKEYCLNVDTKKGYRVIQFSNEEDLLNSILEYVEGFQYCWPAFTSTSTEIQKQFITKYSIIFEIIFNADNKWNKFDVSQISEIQSEKEILLMPYFIFQVKSIEPIVINDKNYPKITLQENQQHWSQYPPQERVIWFDPHINNKENTSYQQKLKDMFEISYFSDKIDDVLDIIIKDNFKFRIITCGSQGQALIDKIHQYDQVYQVFIYCWDKEKHKVWINQYSKIVGIANDYDELKQQIKSQN